MPQPCAHGCNHTHSAAHLQHSSCCNPLQGVFQNYTLANRNFVASHGMSLFDPLLDVVIYDQRDDYGATALGRWLHDHHAAKMESCPARQCCRPHVSRSAMRVM
jgi:hypothetical protein